MVKQGWQYIGHLIVEKAFIRRCIVIWMAYSMGDLMQVLTRKIDQAEVLTAVHATIIGSIFGIAGLVLAWRYKGESE